MAGSEEAAKPEPKLFPQSACLGACKPLQARHLQLMRALLTSHSSTL